MAIDKAAKIDCISKLYVFEDITQKVRLLFAGQLFAGHIDIRILEREGVDKL